MYYFAVFFSIEDLWWKIFLPLSGNAIDTTIKPD
jgi:hypothetical protein